MSKSKTNARLASEKSTQSFEACSKSKKPANQETVKEESSGVDELPDAAIPNAPRLSLESKSSIESTKLPSSDAQAGEQACSKVETKTTTLTDSKVNYKYLIF